jgi:hypothetical protein
MHRQFRQAVERDWAGVIALEPLYQLFALYLADLGD